MRNVNQSDNFLSYPIDSLSHLSKLITQDYK